MGGVLHLQDMSFLFNVTNIAGESIDSFENKSLRILLMLIEDYCVIIDLRSITDLLSGTFSLKLIRQICEVSTFENLNPCNEQIAICMNLSQLVDTSRKM